MKTLHNVDFHEDICQDLKAFIKAKNLPLSQKGLHFGNFCLINISDELMEEIKNNFKVGENEKIQYRNTKHIIERKDLQTYKKGDKITIIFMETDFLPVRNQKGTIHSVNVSPSTGLTTLVIRAYGCQIRGWNICEGDFCLFKKGW